MPVASHSSRTAASGSDSPESTAPPILDQYNSPGRAGSRSWNGVDNVADSTYFVVPLNDHIEINFDHLEPEEVGNVLGAGWWTPAELDGVAFRPPNLPEIMSAALTAYDDRPR